MCRPTLTSGPLPRSLLAPLTLQVLSVDACQGDEADAIIVSTVRNVFSSSTQGLSRCGQQVGRQQPPPSAALDHLRCSSTVPRLLTSRPPSSASFFRDRRRVNVALSRARHLCVVAGSAQTLRLPKARPWPAVLASYQSGAMQQ